MRTATRRLKFSAAVLVVGLVLVGVGVYGASERRLSQRYDVTPESVAIPTDDAAVARGEYLVRAVTTCTLCHGDDGGARCTRTWGWSAWSRDRT